MTAMTESEETKCHTYDPQSQPPKFGHDIRKYFGFEDGYINLNHGAYGSLPLPVATECAKISAEIEACPDRFLRLTYQGRLEHARSLVANLIGAEVDECVMVPNATHGLNTILRNFEWHEGDIIIGATTTYGAIAKTIQYLSDIPPHPTVSKFLIQFPTTHAQIVANWKEHLLSAVSSVAGAPEKRKVVAVIDGIISTPGARLPWAEMVKICRETGVWSVIDAAHMIGQEVDINLSEVKPDFWVSNCHKWLFAKRSCCVMYVPKRNQHIIKSSMPTSHEYVSPTHHNFVKQHEWTGTMDFIPYLSVPAAIEFRNWIGGEHEINKYCHQLALDGGKRLAEIFGTSVMENEKGELTANMVNVELPLAGVPPTWDVDDFLKAQLLLEWHCYAAHYWHNGKWWTRCSAQVWSEISDFEYLGKAFTEVCKQAKKKFGNQ
ncbi:PLP-dependent transferase [Neolentinus lepideus HHB14362 ss-1]|uniref:PLP-dependent transferase n=1 Tax=Neolentinus lepideus HHB14362 ss-1 TaxID=1314782 RepID=A0A165N109_9AGAM|nr:PLP-dependent transferase [Neolentinus lepideus HHB14362 ss-1]